MKRMHLLKRSRAVTGACAAIALAATLSACTTNEETGNPEGWEDIKPAVVPEVQALVPADIQKRGTISMGTNPPFAPMEFKDSNGTIIGIDVDLARAAAATMGLELVVQEQDFSLILPSISAGTVDFGAAGFTDNEERRKNYDFVNYLSAGLQWAQQTGENVDPDNACGLTVAVQKGTVSESDDVAVRSEECVKQGKPAITMLSYESSDQAFTALVLGRADAVSADSPVTAYAVTRADGKIEKAGRIYEAADYGWPVPKDSELGPALKAALQHLIDTGDYAKTLQPWGVTEGLKPQATINGEE
ncbi:ABC transporter substrate-binding protein [Corynebacterium sp. H128]|uniref:ABC transporter substrate-binding protein n=1 Tax=Corynebacterium sp. H128 TaxID=3133427 RepID=UPI00403F78E5